MIKKFIQVFISGGFSAFSLPYFSYFPFMVIGFGFFFIKLYQLTSLKTSFFLGLIFGFGYFLVSLHWIIFPLFFDSKYLIFIPIILIIFPILLSIFFALPSFFITLLKQKNFFNFGFFSQSLLISLVFFSFEFLRCKIFGGFPWNLFGHIWESNFYFTIIAKFFGIYGLSLLTTLWIIIIAKLIINQKIKLLFIVFPLFPVILFLFGILSENSNFGKKIIVRVVQPNISQEIKWSQLHMKENIEALINLSLVRFKENKKPELIIWPEVALPYFLNENSYFLKDLLKKIPSDVTLITGGLSKVKNKNNEKIYNSLYVIKNAEIYQIYNKVRLVPFGEFIPLRNFIGIDKITEGTQDFSAGKKRENILLQTSNGHFYFEPSICYEGIFPEKKISDLNPLFLINITNDAWFGSTTGPSQHLSFSRIRAVERGAPLVRVANTGISAIFDNNGREIKSIPLNSKGYFDIELSINNIDTHYSKFGLYSLIHLIIALVLFAFIVDNSIRIKNRNYMK